MLKADSFLAIVNAASKKVALRKPRKKTSSDLRSMLANTQYVSGLNQLAIMKSQRIARHDSSLFLSHHALLIIICLFMILLILIQKGRGGGLSGRSAEPAVTRRSVPKPATC